MAVMYISYLWDIFWRKTQKIYDNDSNALSEAYVISFDDYI